MNYEGDYNGGHQQMAAGAGYQGGNPNPNAGGRFAAMRGGADSRQGGGYNRSYGGRGGGGAGGEGGYGGGYGGYRGGGGGGYGGGYRSAPHHPPNEHYSRPERPEEEIFKEHTPGINFDQYEAIKVSIFPNDTEGCDTFQGMNLAPLLQENVTRCRYTKPTPVQRYGIPCVLKGRDLMACAQTGSGKTAAYLLPAVNFMLVNNVQQSQLSNGVATPSALVVAPTRELSIQIYEEGRKFTFRTGLRCVVVYGGAEARHQMYELQRGCGLLVATPGRLWDMYTRGLLTFSGIQFLVLDEADRMLDMGFEPAIRQIVQGPESDMPRTGARQTLMYSATFPKEIQQLAREFLNNHYYLQVGRVGSTTENITQDVRWVEDMNKRSTLVDLLREHQSERTLVFVEKKRDADYLQRFLRQNQFSCMSIHGDRVQREREEALHQFKSGACRVLVATDVASRGLDIPDVSLVVQYDLPSNIDDYVHRIGRTGRAGKRGTAVSLFNEKNINIVDDLVTLLRETNQTVLPEIQALMKKPHPQQSHMRGRGRGGRGGAFGGYGGGAYGGGYGGRGGYRGGGGYGGGYGGYRGGGGGGYGGGNNYRGNGRPAYGGGVGGGYNGAGGYGGGAYGGAMGGGAAGANNNYRDDMFGQKKM